MQDMVDLSPTKEVGGWAGDERLWIRGKVRMSGPKATASVQSRRGAE